MSEIEEFLDGLEFPIDYQQEKDYEAIKNALKRSKEGGVVLEVLYEAMNSLKSDPSQNIEKVMYDALWDWDC